MAPNEIDDRDCMICRNALRTHKFIPCNHLAACDKCSKDHLYNNRECPVCRSRVGGYLQILKSYR